MRFKQLRDGTELSESVAEIQVHNSSVQSKMQSNLSKVLYSQLTLCGHLVNTDSS